eukprot:TRINITY_DN2547_c0_g1_i1.p1 TRINITY_DN2547_c0_g1~~TRINITY_DN2547_c0_g1_i1.p1  ORF type:complete len:111 (+),score=10.96 TRINITY_DN2547_c0_g1_i1:207-539(+)
MTHSNFNKFADGSSTFNYIKELSARNTNTFEITENYYGAADCYTVILVDPSSGNVDTVTPVQYFYKVNDLFWGLDTVIFLVILVIAALLVFGCVIGIICSCVFKACKKEV